MTEEGFNYKPSKTWKVLTGCGNLYITADFTNEGVHKVRLQRTSRLKCPLSILNPLYRSATYQSRRDIEQSIEDHKARLDPQSGKFECCDQFNASIKGAWKRGELAAYSCSDALARVLEIILKENGSAIPK